MKKRLISAALVCVLTAGLLTGCGPKAVAPDAKTGTYEELVTYMTAKGLIGADAQPVNINETAGYLTDNTGGQWEDLVVADNAEDFDGMYLFYWDPADESGLYTDIYQNIAVNGNMILLGGGAALMPLEDLSGNYGIAFAEDFEKKDDALKAFDAVTSK